MDVINLGILAHVDAGKTTLTEGMLFQAGCIRKMGNVDDGTTVTDSMDLEKKRGMTIKSSVISFEWNHLKINLIDTPGHFDFLSEVESVLHVLDVVGDCCQGRGSAADKIVFQEAFRTEDPNGYFYQQTGQDGGKL